MFLFLRDVFVHFLGDCHPCVIPYRTDKREKVALSSRPTHSYAFPCLCLLDMHLSIFLIHFRAVSLLTSYNKWTFWGPKLITSFS